MSLRPPSSTPTATIFPYTTLFRSHPSGGRPPPASDPDDLHRHGHRRPAAGHTRRRGRGGAPFHRRGGGVRRQPGDADHAVPDPDPLFAGCGTNRFTANRQSAAGLGLEGFARSRRVKGGASLPMNEIASPGQLRLAYASWALVPVPAIFFLGF